MRNDNNCDIIFELDPPIEYEILHRDDGFTLGSYMVKWDGIWDAHISVELGVINFYVDEAISDGKITTDKKDSIIVDIINEVIEHEYIHHFLVLERVPLEFHHKIIKDIVGYHTITIGGKNETL